jgi:nucleoside-diphosphate-sugar epimerase
MVACPDKQERVIVTGASSQVGRFLLPRLRAAGFAVSALSRRTQPPESGVDWLSGDLKRYVDWSAAAGARALIHAAEITLIGPHLEHLAGFGVRRVIAFSSTSRLTKQDSADPAERRLARALADAEQGLSGICDTLGMVWTLFLPTLVYGAGLDRNVSFIAQFIRRFGWFPLVAGGLGLRQPVHADDLAAACLGALDNPRAYGGVYVLTGGETLSYRAMVERVFQGLGQPPRLLPVPLGLLRVAIMAGRLLPAYRHLSPQMADRVNRDLCFDSGPARRDFGYSPRRFRFDPASRNDQTRENADP